MDNKMQKELEELKKNPDRVRAMIALLEGLLEEEDQQLRVKNAKKQYDLVELEESIAYHLSNLGVPQQTRGYMYIMEAIAIAVENPEILNNITEGLYPSVAHKFGKKAETAQTAIRRTIKDCCARVDPEVLKNYFGNSLSKSKGKPNPSQFIVTLANLVRREMNT